MQGSGDNGQSGENRQYSEKVDLNDLDWEDRERVLRLLFSKMNAGAPGNAARAQAKQILRDGGGGEQRRDDGSSSQQIAELPEDPYGEE